MPQRGFGRSVRFAGIIQRGQVDAVAARGKKSVVCQLCSGADPVSELRKGERPQRPPQHHFEKPSLVLHHQPDRVAGYPRPGVAPGGTGPDPVPSDTSLVQRPGAMPSEAAPAGSHDAGKGLPEVLAQARTHDD